MRFARTTGIFLLLLSGLSLQAQDTFYKRMHAAKTSIDTGAFKNFVRYDLGSFYLFVGTGENNLKFNIAGKSSNTISFSYDNSFSDALTLKPVFFINEKDSSDMLLMMEIAAEYSWGQEIMLIQGQSVNYIGLLEYAAAIEDNSSIANHCRVARKGKNILILLDSIPVIDFARQEIPLNGADMRIRINTSKMKLDVK